jgi:hypothetical protein
MILQSVNYRKCNHRSWDCWKNLLRLAEHNTRGRNYVKKTKTGNTPETDGVSVNMIKSVGPMAV